MPISVFERKKKCLVGDLNSPHYCRYGANRSYPNSTYYCIIDKNVLNTEFISIIFPKVYSPIKIWGYTRISILYPRRRRMQRQFQHFQFLKKEENILQLTPIHSQPYLLLYCRQNRSQYYIYFLLLFHC